MQVPLIADTHGLPLVSSLRNSQVMRPAPSNSVFVAFVRVLRLLRGEGAEHLLQHGEVGAAGKAVLAGGDDRALDRGVAGDLVDDRVQLVHHLFGEDVHRAAGHVPGDERDAVGVGFEVKLV